MSDYPFELLYQQYQNELRANPSVKCIWIADENFTTLDSSSLQFSENTLLCTNRIDVFKSLEQKSPLTELSDFAFQNAEADSYDAIFYRVSKEKPIVHHIINESFKQLNNTGKLYITGLKNDGTKTYFDKAKKLFGGAFEWKKEAQQSYLGVVSKQSIQQEQTNLKWLDDTDYQTVRTIAQVETITFDSKPGVYGWNKIDKGSELLISELTPYIESRSLQPKQLLDLGCGFGYLSTLAGQALNIPVTATDNNIAATELCKHNLASNQVAGKVILDDCGSSINEKYDLILCNPPFHQGFSVDGQLTNHFLENCKRLLANDGIAIFVVNSFIPLEKKAQQLFDHVIRFAENKSFKLVALSH